MTQIGNFQPDIKLDQSFASANNTPQYTVSQNDNDTVSLSAKAPEIPWYKKHAGKIIAGVAVLGAIIAGYFIFKRKGPKSTEEIKNTAKSKLESNGQRDFTSSGPNNPIKAPEVKGEKETKDIKDLIDPETDRILLHDKDTMFGHQDPNYTEFFNRASAKEVTEYAKKCPEGLRSFSEAIDWNISRIRDKANFKASAYENDPVYLKLKDAFNTALDSHIDNVNFANYGSHAILTNIEKLGNDNQLKKIVDRFYEAFPGAGVDGRKGSSTTEGIGHFIDALSSKGSNATKKEFVEKILDDKWMRQDIFRTQYTPGYGYSEVKELVSNMDKEGIISIVKSTKIDDTAKGDLLVRAAIKNNGVLREKAFWESMSPELRDKLLNIINEGKISSLDQTDKFLIRKYINELRNEFKKSC